MIDKLEILNFQAHKASTIEFSPNLTAILGTNNHGKSAILKALHKVIRNSPDGNSFIRDYSDKMELTLYNDNHIVKLIVDKSKSAEKGNAYEVDGLEFVKFGRNNIPREVRDVLPLSDVQTFGDVDIDMNFQQQLDGLFLITGAGLSSIRSKVLGKITGADVAQRAVQICGAKEKDLTGQVNRLKATIGDTALQLERYSDLVNHEILMSHIGLAIINYDTVKLLIDTHNNLLLSFAQIATNIANEENILDILSVDVSTNLAAAENIKLQISKINELVGIDTQILVNNEILSVDTGVSQAKLQDISNTHEILGLMRDMVEIDVQIKKQVEIRSIELHDTSPIDVLYNNYQLAFNLSIELNNIELQMDQVKEEIHTMRNEENNANLTYEMELEDIGICPTCDKPFKEHS